MSAEKIVVGRRSFRFAFWTGPLFFFFGGGHSLIFQGALNINTTPSSYGNQFHHATLVGLLRLGIKLNISRDNQGILLILRFGVWSCTKIRSIMTSMDNKPIQNWRPFFLLHFCWGKTLGARFCLNLNILYTQKVPTPGNPLEPGPRTSHTLSHPPPWVLTKKHPTQPAVSRTRIDLWAEFCRFGNPRVQLDVRKMKQMMGKHGSFHFHFRVNFAIEFGKNGIQYNYNLIMMVSKAIYIIYNYLLWLVPISLQKQKNMMWQIPSRHLKVKLVGPMDVNRAQWSSFSTALT